MRFVTLNLDVGDAAALRQAVEGALVACSCRENAGRARCPTCAALDAIRDDLGRFLTSPARDGSRLLSRTERVLATERCHPSDRREGGGADDRRLWVVPSALLDA